MLFNGRNRVEVIEDGNKKKVIKELVGTNEEITRRIDNIKKWNDLLSLYMYKTNQNYEFENQKIICDYVEGENLQSLLFNNEMNFSPDLIISITKMLEGIHNLKVGEKEEVAVDNLFSSIPLDLFEVSSGGQIELLRLVHNDIDIQNYIKENERRISKNKCFVHGDIRLDQFIVSDEGLAIIDFEEFGEGIPELDLANFWGSIIFSNLLKVFSIEVDKKDNISSLNNKILIEGSRALDESFQWIKLSYNSYQNNRDLDIKLIHTRMCSFIIGRLYSRSFLSAKLSSIDLAIAGITKELLVNFDELKGDLYGNN